MTMADREKLRALDDQRIKENIKLRASLKDSRTSMQMFTGTLSRGFVVSKVFADVVNKSKGLASSYEEQKNEIDELTQKIANLDQLLKREKRKTRFIRYKTKRI